MTDFTTSIHLIASGNDLQNDLRFLQKIIITIYKNHAILTRDWLGTAIARKKRTPDIEKADWTNIVKESLDAIKQSDMVIAEISLCDFNQGLQTYLAAQYKKPTLVLTRSEIENSFVSGIENPYLTIERYTREDELDLLVTKFIKKNTIPQKDLRFNMVLDRPIYRYLREKSYETNMNKSELVRGVLKQAMEKRK